MRWEILEYDEANDELLGVIRRLGNRKFSIG